VVSFLICNGASIHTVAFEGGRASKADKKGEPLSNVVCRFGDVDVARLLILNGAEVPQAAINGEDPILHTACGYWHVEIVRLLQENGVDLQAPWYRGVGADHSKRPRASSHKASSLP
jgi:ankyrin repeat protein